MGVQVRPPFPVPGRSVGTVDNRTEIRDFLATRRAKLTPEQVGLPTAGRRRVPGLRREEVAVLAGVRATDRVRPAGEVGHIIGVSDEVLDAVARALRLSDAERNHLFNLARAAKPVRTPRRPAKTQIPASMQRVLDSMTGTAAFVRNGRLDMLRGATSSAGRSTRPCSTSPLTTATSPGSISSTRALPIFYPDYDGALATAVALLRTEAGRDPHNKDLTELVGELATRSEAFRTRWGAHDVRLHRGGVKTFNHPTVGYLELAYDSMDLVAAPGLVLTAYTAEPATPSADNLALLASWAATEAATTLASTTRDNACTLTDEADRQP